VTKRQDLKRKYAAAAKLRTKKVDEIRETGQVSVPRQLRTEAQRLLREWHSIHLASIEIQDELARFGKTAGSLLPSVGAFFEYRECRPNGGPITEKLGLCDRRLCYRY
jgi:hypothetical protein